MAIAPTLSHVFFMTRRYEEMIAWYEKVFGAHVVHGDPALSFLTYDEEHHRFAFANLNVMNPDDSSEAKQGNIGVNHIAYTFATAAELLETYDRLKGEGIMPYWPVHHGFTLSLYYQDPDGNRLEFQVETCSKEDAIDFMHTEVFASNPIGVQFDPEDLLSKYRAGVPETDLIARPDTEPSPVPPQQGLG